MKATIMSVSLPFLLLSSCYIETHESDHEKDRHRSIRTENHYYEDQQEFELEDESKYGDDNWDELLTEIDKRTQRLKEQGLCQDLAVQVHYLLDQNVGSGQTIVLEAFDNEFFSGYPKSTAQKTGFDASAKGSRTQLDLCLEPGKYYLRAYIKPQSQTIKPYVYENMELISEQPVGVLGALSDAEYVVIDEREDTPRDIQIFISQAFRKPKSEAPSNAFARFLVHNNSDLDIPRNRFIYIELFDNSDFESIPVQSFELSTQNMRVLDDEGKAEYLTEELDLGQYYLRAYIDLDGNQFWDEGEPVYIWKQNGQDQISIESQKIKSFKIEF